MSEKTKKTSANIFLIRSSGLALSAPIVVMLGGLLLLLNIIVATVIFGGLSGIGGMQGLLAPFLPILTLIFLVGMGAMIGLFYSVLRYAGGLHKLSKRLRGIRDEQARVERLMGNQNPDDEVDLLNLYTTDDELGHKNQR